VGRARVGVAGGVVLVVVVVVVVVVITSAPRTVFKLLRESVPTLVVQGLLQRFPGGRAATSREVADVIVFLCSDRAG
jgi:NAD(P)-dependent dehydrogenase (short-subunit alcohol dehydrogenase family)